MMRESGQVPRSPAGMAMGQILSTPMIIAGALMIWAAYKRPQLFGNAVKEAK